MEMFIIGFILIYSELKLVVFLILLISLLAFLSTRKVSPIFLESPTKTISGENYQGKILWPTANTKVKPGESVGVSVDSKGMIYCLHRGESKYGGRELIAEPTLIVINPDTGEEINTLFSNQFKSPHGLAIDSYDNIWITDTTLNKVFKFDSNGKLLAMYGDEYKFYQELFYKIKDVIPKFPLFATKMTLGAPTDIFPFDDGSFILTDGYRNNRLLKISKKGEVIWQINSSGIKDGEFNLPHNVVVDKDENIYVADRSNCRIQVFKSDGQWLKTISSNEIGRPFGLTVDKDKNLYIANGGDLLYGRSDNPQSSIVILSSDGTILNRISNFGSQASELNVAHDIAVDDFGRIFVADLNNKCFKIFTKDN